MDDILANLKILENDETLLVQSGKPVARMKTHPDGAQGTYIQFPTGSQMGDMGAF
ncbi:MAG: hypothetical protein WDM78_24020 [Puia sp.]